MCKSLTILCVMLLSVNILSAQGISDWQNKTPGGNLMYDAGGGTVLLISKTGREFEGIDSWYFYNNHIIGNTTSANFVVNELTGEITTFHSIGEQNNYIIESKLKPRFWTRRYSDNWKLYEHSFIIVGTLTIFCLPFLIYSIWKVRNWFTEGGKHKNIKKHTLIFFVIISIVIIRALLDEYPKSL